MRPAIDQLTEREGKVLRYVTSNLDEMTLVSKCVCKIEWSDLPHTDMQARFALGKLRKLGLVERVGKDQYKPTLAGREVLTQANNERRWQTSPSPKKTNVFFHHREDKQ